MTGSWLIADELQSTRYSPVRQSISALARNGGKDRWIATSAMFVVGACYLLTAAGLTMVTTRARVGLVLAGFAAIGIAACPEPEHGSTPQHLIFTAFGSVVIALWPLLLISTGPPRSPLLRARICWPAAVVFSGLLLWTLAETQSGSALGLAERVSTSTQICFPALVSWSLLRAGRRTSEPVVVSAERLSSTASGHRARR